MMMEQVKKKRRRTPMIIGIVITVVIVLVVLWTFTPFSFIGVHEDEEYLVNITVGEYNLTATMNENTSSQAFKRMLEHGAVTVNMRDYEGMEKVGMLWRGLPVNNEQITAHPGDIILFMGSSLVVYYNQNSWDFTRMGHINDVTQEELKEILGSGNVSMTFELPK